MTEKMTEKTAAEKTKTADKKTRRSWDKKRIEKSTKTQKEKTARLNAKAEQVTQERRQGKPLKYDSSKLLAFRFSEYFYNCDHTIIDQEKNRTQPYTLTGLQLAAGLTGSAWIKYAGGEYDNKVSEHTKQNNNGEWIEYNIQDNNKIALYDYEQRQELDGYMQFLYDNGDYTAILYTKIIEKARLLVQEQAENRLYIQGRVADIFTLKSQYGWQEQNTTVHRLEIATPEQARKALQDLQLLDE